jgi:hypothetical protein
MSKAVSLFEDPWLKIHQGETSRNSHSVNGWQDMQFHFAFKFTSIILFVCGLIVGLPSYWLKFPCTCFSNIYQ